MTKKRIVYMRRRIIALAILALIILVFIGIINNWFKGRKNKLSLDEESGNELYQYVSSSSIDKINKSLSLKYGLNTKEFPKISEDLLVYRQNKLKDHSMGRSNTSQALLPKEVYLTFDDGPSEVTVDILDILKDYNIQATFFVIGRNVRNYPEIMQRIKDEGHEIGIHTQTHDYKDIYASEETLSKDINACLESVRSVLGKNFTTNLYRFPGGSFDRDKYKPLVEKMGYVYFDWNTLNGDGEGHGQSPEQLTERYFDTAEGYHIQIALMHDSSTKQATADSLPNIIDKLQEDGFEFKTLGDL